MRVSLNWVKEFTKVDLDIDRLVEKIGAQLGEVEGVEYLGDKYKGIYIVKVVSCQPHPNADKLKVCKIDDGGKEPNVKRDAEGHIEVVCGAPNVHEGMLAVWIPPGGTVPSTLGKEGELILEAREIRGVVSNGMLASAHELAISDDHSGIVEVSPQDGQPGDDFAATYKLDDYIIDIENKMFTHRPDCFGILGVAREIAGIQQIPFKSPDWYKGRERQAKPPLKLEELPLEVKNELPGLVPRFTAQVIRGVKVGPSDLKTQTYLSRLGVRPINDIVDVTNMVMVLTGQPMHAYDYDKVKAGSDKAAIIVRRPKEGEKLNLLNGKQLTLRQEDIMIASDSQPIGLGGVMGGSDTEVDANTKNIVLECATFDMYSIRRTAMQYGLFTDAVTRFTKGQSPLQNDRIMAYAMKLVSEKAGGQQASDVKDAQGELKQNPFVRTTAKFINERLGLSLQTGEIRKLLQNVEFEFPTITDDSPEGPFEVKAPFWRTDIEIPEDIVEEVGRLYGYDHLPQELPKRSLTPKPTDPLLATKTQIRDILSAAGANEVLTYTFVHGGLLDKVGQNKDNAYQLSNALSPDLQYYRLSLIPSLLEKVHPNIKQGYSEFALFEINPVHAKDFIDKEGLPVEDQRLALVFAADEKTAKQKYAGAPYYQAKKYLINLLSDIGISTSLVFEPAINHEPKQSISQAAIAPFEKQRSAIVKTKDGEFIGELGEFRTSVRKSLKLPEFIAGFELDVNQLMKLRSETKRYSPIPRFPKVEQDLSMLVAADIKFGEILSLATEQLNKNKPKNSLSELVPLDIFQQSEDATHKHVAFRLSIASYERTLTAEEVNNLLNEIAAAAQVKFGAKRI